MTNTVFEPIFVVGAARSGTTFLAVLLDRHSRIVIPPETQFYCQFLIWDVDEHFWQKDVASIVNETLSFRRIADLALDPGQVTALLPRYNKTPAGLLRSLLESYAQAKNSARVGEKSPRHNEHVETILQDFPQAKIIALVRDGRDVVNSLLKAPWTMPDNPRRFLLACRDWLVQARRTESNQRRFGPERHLTVKYEELLQSPEDELRKICAFLDEPFEPGMLDISVASDTVPDWEAQWKSKARTAPDPTRIGVWKRQCTPRQIWKMNTIMGPMLRHYGYTDTSLQDCPLGYRLVLWPYVALRWESLHPIAVAVLRAARALGRPFRSPG